MDIKTELEIYKMIVNYRRDYYKNNYKRLDIKVNFNDLHYFKPELDNLALYVNSLINMYQDSYKSLAYAFAYNRIANDLKEKDKTLSDFYKYDERNYYFRYFVYQYFSMMEHVLFIINESAELKIPEESVKFATVKEKIKKKKDFASKWKNIWDIILKIYPQGKDRDLYNIQKHRYSIGIDYLSRSWIKASYTKDEEFEKLYKILSKRKKKKEKEKEKEKESKGYFLINSPDVRYDTCSQKFQVVMQNFYKLLKMLCKLPKVKNIVK